MANFKTHNLTLSVVHETAETWVVDLYPEGIEPYFVVLRKGKNPLSPDFMPIEGESLTVTRRADGSFDIPFRVALDKRILICIGA